MTISLSVTPRTLSAAMAGTVTAAANATPNSLLRINSSFLHVP
jgi:hypothetical protein